LMGRQLLFAGAVGFAVVGLLVAFQPQAPLPELPVVSLRATYDGTEACVQGLDASGQPRVFSAVNFTLRFFDANGSELGGENYEMVKPEHFTGTSLCQTLGFGKRTAVRFEVKGLIEGVMMEASS